MNSLYNIASCLIEEQLHMEVEDCDTEKKYEVYPSDIGITKEDCLSKVLNAVRNKYGIHGMMRIDIYSSKGELIK